MADIELKGLQGLRDLQTTVSEKSTKQGGDVYRKLSTEILYPGKYQPRKNLSAEQLADLADSIKSQGIIQPLIVRKVQPDKYEIIAGERRWRAAKQANVNEVPVIIRDIDDNTALAFALIENIQRENLNPIEEAMAFAKFRDEFSMSHADIANTVGRSRATITNTLRLLSLNETTKELLAEGKLEMGHARALLTLSAEQQVIIANKIIEKNLTVRDTENLIKFQKQSKIEKQVYFADVVENWVERLTKSLSSKVSVRINQKGEGKVTINFGSADEMEWLVNKMDS